MRSAQYILCLLLCTQIQAVDQKSPDEITALHGLLSMNPSGGLKRKGPGESEHAPPTKRHHLQALHQLRAQAHVPSPQARAAHPGFLPLAQSSYPDFRIIEECPKGFLASQQASPSLLTSFLQFSTAFTICSIPSCSGPLVFIFHNPSMLLTNNPDLDLLQPYNQNLKTLYKNTFSPLVTLGFPDPFDLPCFLEPAITLRALPENTPRIIINLGNQSLFIPHDNYEPWIAPLAGYPAPHRHLLQHISVISHLNGTLAHRVLDNIITGKTTLPNRSLLIQLAPARAPTVHIPPQPTHTLSLLRITREFYSKASYADRNDLIPLTFHPQDLPIFCLRHKSFFICTPAPAKKTQLSVQKTPVDIASRLDTIQRKIQLNPREISLVSEIKNLFFQSIKALLCLQEDFALFDTDHTAPSLLITPVFHDSTHQIRLSTINSALYIIPHENLPESWWGILRANRLPKFVQRIGAAAHTNLEHILGNLNRTKPLPAAIQGAVLHVVPLCPHP